MTDEMHDHRKEVGELRTKIAVLEERLRGGDKALEIALKQYPTQGDSIALKEKIDTKIAESTGWWKVLTVVLAIATIVLSILTYLR